MSVGHYAPAARVSHGPGLRVLTVYTDADPGSVLPVMVEVPQPGDTDPARFFLTPDMAREVAAALAAAVEVTR